MNCSGLSAHSICGKQDLFPESSMRYLLDSLHAAGQVLPALGAQQCVEFCGGLGAVLAAVCGEMLQALDEEPQQQQPTACETPCAEDSSARCAAMD